MWMPCLQRLIHLVGGFNPSEKYEFVNGKDDIPYIYIYPSHVLWKKHVPKHQPDISLTIINHY